MRTMNEILLKIEGLHARIGDKEILKGIDLEIRKGEVHAVGIGADEDKVVCEDQVDRLLELGFLLGRCERRQPGLGAPGVEVVDPHDALHGMDAAPRHETRGLEEQGADPAGKAAVRSFCENLLS